jgi:glutathione S-transferase
MSAAMGELILYGNHASGHSYKVRLFLTLADVPHRYVWIDLDLPRSERPEEFRRASQFGEVPVLVQDGAAQAQSNAILLTLARATGRFGPPPGSSWEQLTTWLFWEANRIGFSMPNLRWLKRFEPDPIPGAIAWVEGRARADLDRLDQELSRRPFLAGEAPSIADISASAYVFLASEADVDVKRWPAVDAWLGRIRALPRWQEQYTLMAR